MFYISTTPTCLAFSILLCIALFFLNFEKKKSWHLYLGLVFSFLTSFLASKWILDLLMQIASK